jgi:hypothetical protein
MPPTRRNLKSEEERPPREARAPRATSSRARNASADDGTPKPRTAADKKLAASIAGGYQSIGGLIIGIGARFEDQGLVGTGAATINNAEMIAEAWIDVSQKNPKVKAWLEKITEVSALGVLVSLHVATVLPLLMDRGVIPPGMMAFAAPPASNGNGNGSGESQAN